MSASMDPSLSNSLFSEVEYPSTDDLGGGGPHLHVEELARPIELALADELRYQWSVAETHRHLVQRAIGTFRHDFENNTNETDRPESVPELVLAFLSLLVEQVKQNQDATPYGRHGIECIKELLDAFEHDFLQGRNIHVFVDQQVASSQNKRQDMVRAYVAALAAAGRPAPRTCRNAALFKGCHAPGGTNTYAAFGGICHDGDLLEELRILLEGYRHVVEPLVKAATGTLLELLATSDVSTLRQYDQGLDVLQWLSAPDKSKAPCNEYHQTTAVSFPLIGLVQFANYAIICDQLDLSPGQVADSLRGMTGQSPGIIVAATLAGVTDWEDFHSGLVQATTILFHLGSAAQEHTPKLSVSHVQRVSGETVANGEGSSCTPMLHIVGCAQEQFDRSIATLNHHLEPNGQVSIGIINAPLDVVVTGPTLSLCALAANLRKTKAPNGLDQTRIAVSKRKPDFSLRFLPTSAPLHSIHLAQAAALATTRLAHIHMTPSKIRLPTYDSHTGADLRSSQASDLVPKLVQMVLCEPCDWPKATLFQDATHIIDFGPGGTSGVGSLLHRSKDGTGVRVLLAGLAGGNQPEYGYRAELFQNMAIAPKSWLQEFGPTLTKQADGTIQINNKMTRLLGLPPLMVAGMTPTTASWEFVSAIMNAGYHVELAAGGLHSALDFTQAVHRLAQSIPRGRGICINVIYASPKQIKWQIPLIRKLHSEGQPIDGITFGAGVPSQDVAQEYVDMGLRYLSFKPGSGPAIQQVIDIARANKNFPILLQWTGGRGGGHHSYEDFHAPMLHWYGRIRQCANIVLLAGSGFGGAEDTYPYMSGAWSVAFDRPPMPFDGVLFGSRMMVAKEAKTSRGAKEAIVAAPGIDDEGSWYQSYTRPCGGIITVKSEMGEPIHKVATRGVLLWKELDETVFSITDKAKRLDKLKDMKAYLVERLNKDYQKVWFGQNANGDVVDLEDMTYAEVLRRLVQLLYVSKERRWIDQGYMQLTLDFVKRMYSHMPASASKSASFPKALDLVLASPLEAIDTICKQCHRVADKVISYRDARYFVLMCKRVGRKPPTFVPDIDEDFEYWFKKDSLWQSEDLASVVDEDAGRTCILQGPVAARYSTIVDEPVQQILDEIRQGHISRIVRDGYDNDPSVVQPMTLDVPWEQPPVPLHCTVYHEGGKLHFQISSSVPDNQLPNEQEWFQSLAGRPSTWLFDLIMSRDIMHGAKSVANPIRRVLAPVQGMHVEVTQTSDGDFIELALHETESGRVAPSVEVAQYSVTVRKETDVVLVEFHIRENVELATLPMVFKFTHHPATPLHPVHEVTEGRNERLQDLYCRLWLGTDLESSTCRSALAWTPSSLYQPPIPRVTGREQVVTSRSIEAFEKSIQHSSQITSPKTHGGTTAGIDFAMVVGWEALMKSVFAPAVDGRFLNLVHLSNELILLNDSISLTEGDVVSSSAQVTAIRDESMGRIVQVDAIIAKAQAPVVRITSEFLFRDNYADSSVCFEKKTEPPSLMHVDTHSKAAVLKSKDWIRWKDLSVDLLGRELVFEMESLAYLDDNASSASSSRTQTWGTIYDQEDKQIVGTIRHQQQRQNTCSSNPPLDYCRRHARPVDSLQHLEHAQRLGSQDRLEFTAPSTNSAYSRASGDFNPIHTSLPFAKYAGLPGTITHGMWISAAVRKLVGKAAGCNERVRMRSYKITFLSMLLPGATVGVTVNHVAMKQGLRVLSFEACNIATGNKVVGGEAVVDQAETAYLFTGQGSQKVGMGMDLYASCDVARGVWGRADRFYSQTYGFRISDIVRHNPKQLTVHFGGRLGQAVRKNYMDITMENNGRTQQVLGPINEHSTKYVFQHSDGLLFSTLFAQPALTVTGHAQYQHLRSKGLIAANALFAGHSLGEYTAVSTIGQVVPFETLLSITFLRALLMNSAVTRNAQGRSQFGMVAINPSRSSGSHIDTAIMRQITSKVAAATGELLEVVNYNIETQQYVATGSLKALACLSAVTDQLASSKAPATHNNMLDDAGLDAMVVNAAARVNNMTLESSGTQLKLKRGVATVPLEGVDVPFHSTYLLPRMPAFRHVLETHIPSVDAERLVGKWVTNVTGKPFDISREGIREVYEKTKSRVLGDLLEKMKTDCSAERVQVAV
ncbi:acyl transferase domain-containing protein [Diplogelasinospora grovesii]|uniref:Acyl transferase domain-containing protein n=1 Tax=Diplogelasinospora grovesii TaxID=303347 RepID=A0AAN6MX91_9PEZI|nr:acyl transferase domain-containing protein [Diplogelasinospora grovesii]